MEYEQIVKHAEGMMEASEILITATIKVTCTANERIQDMPGIIDLLQQDIKVGIPILLDASNGPDNYFAKLVIFVRDATEKHLGLRDNLGELK